MRNRSSFEGALWGPFVGDAAALGAHWIYDLHELRKTFPAGIQGFEAPGPGHYHAGKDPGDQTHYGDAALLLLESIAETGRFSELDFARRFERYFSDPTCRSYLDHATRGTLANLKVDPGDAQNGAMDDQPATVSRLAPVVVAHLRDSDEVFFDAIRRVTLVTQNHPAALAFASAHAELLRWILRGSSFDEAFEQTRVSRHVTCEVADALEAAHTLRHLDVEPATARLGQSCGLSQTFPAAIHAALKHSTDFPAAILATIRAGGDSAGRASMIGAWLGAANGLEAIPANWLAKLSQRARIGEAIAQIVAR